MREQAVEPERDTKPGDFSGKLTRAVSLRVKVTAPLASSLKDDAAVAEYVRPAVEL
jgi:hypothetical protein